MVNSPTLSHILRLGLQVYGLLLSQLNQLTRLLLCDRTQYRYHYSSTASYFVNNKSLALNCTPVVVSLY